MRKVIGSVSCAAIALAIAACSDGDVRIKHTGAAEAAVRVAESLDCPERQGDLRLRSKAADGRACAYEGEDGAEVELQLAAGDSLPALESELQALIPAAAQPPTPPEPPELPRGVEAGERKQVRLPGIKIDTQGDRASVHLPGVHVEARGDKADVRVGALGAGVQVRANDGAAEVRISGEETPGDVRSTFLLTSEKPGPTGWRLAGYQTRGSGAGDMVLGVLRARGERDRNLMDDVEDLLDRNVRN